MTDGDFRVIKPWLILTDVGMLTYWAVTGAKALGWMDVPAEWLTWCAGFMALSFWAIRGDFDPVWWGLNLFLLWPMLFLPRLASRL